MRGAGVGDGVGDGVGAGVCANVLSGSFVAAKPATPRVGINFTNDRLLVEVFLPLDFFLVVTGGSPWRKENYLFMGTMVPEPTPWVLSAPYFNWTTFAFPNR